MLRFNEIPHLMATRVPYIVNYGRNLWVDYERSFPKEWRFRKEKGERISYCDASKRYDVSTKSEYRFHWLIDSNGFLFRFEEIGIKNRIGKWAGLQRVIVSILPPQELTKRDALMLLEGIEENEEYHDKSFLIAALEGLQPDQLVTEREVLVFINSEPPED